jgi:hypothetical protein
MTDHSRFILIELRVGNQYGWFSAVLRAPAGSDVECYALPKNACRLDFWNRKMGTPFTTPYRALVWRVADEL